jgi:hypothetical protein
MAQGQTPCKNCGFAVYEEDTQTGCYLGVIDKFRAVGTEIIEAYDHEKEFFVIDRKCLFGRNKKWVADYCSECPDDILKRIRAEIAIKLEVCVYVDEHTTQNEIVETVDALNEQALKPTSLVFLQHPDSTIKEADYNNVVTTSIPWSISFHIEMDATEGGYGEHVDRNRCFDLRIKTVNDSRRKSVITYYMLINAGYQLPPKYISKIDDMINGELRQLVFVKPVDEHDNGLVVQKATHMMIGGNKERPIMDKIRDRIENEQEQESEDDEECKTQPTTPTEQLITEGSCLL